MAGADISLLSALKMKMRWHHSRQQVLAENVANADTPDFRARDLKAPQFEKVLAAQGAGGVRVARTNAAHMAATMSDAGSFKELGNTDWEMTPEGNAVVLEDQMMKVASNQMDYQMVTNLYTKSLGMLRTALGRHG